MFGMKIETLARAVVRSAFRDEGGRKDEALLMSFDLRLSDFTDNLDNTVSAGLHLLYWAPPRSLSITVFSGVGSPFDDYKAIGEWKYETTHDSCWADVQTSTNLYFQMAADLNRVRTESGKEGRAPRDFSTYVSFPLSCDQIFRWVPVEITKDPEDTYNYRRQLKFK